MGNLYSESKLEQTVSQKDLEDLIGITPQEYIEKIIKGIYSKFSEDNIQFGLALWHLKTRK